VARALTFARSGANWQARVLAIVAGLFAGLALSVGLNKVVAHWSIGILGDPVAAAPRKRAG
jgi:hypothetical protein